MDEAALVEALTRAGLLGERAVVHSSLRALGHVVGGGATVARALARVLDTLVVPSCSWGEGSAECLAADAANWRQNGLGAEGPRHVAVPFDPAVSAPVAAMGAIAHAVWRLPGALRGNHPLASFSAVGSRAAHYVSDQSPDEPHVALERLAADAGLVLLLGVDLSRCTALHVAEQRLGRRLFVRWALGRDGSVARVRVGGCSEGFERLWPELRSLFRLERIGQAELRLARLQPLIERAEQVLASNPELSHCSNASCVRCRDAALGGPVPVS